MDKLRLVCVCAIVLAASMPLGPTLPQETQSGRMELQRQAFPPDNLSFLDLVTIAADGGAQRSAHPAQQMGYVLEGEAILAIEGQQDLALTPGMSFKIPAGTTHSIKNTGAIAVKLIVFGVEKDQPPGAPAP